MALLFRNPRSFATLTLLLVFSTSALAFESRLLDRAGAPIAGAQVSVVDQNGTARTDAAGRFTLTPDPQLPATLLIVGSRGEIFPPIYLQTFPAELRLGAAYRETITVTTGATPNIEGTPAAAPVVLGAEEIEQRKPAHIAEAIATTPGVTLRGEGPPAVPVVRGLASGRTLLLIDDARIVAERRAGPSATFVDPLSLGSIEISRGPGSVAYGSDAIGGIVHLRPRDPVLGSPEFRYDLWSSFGATNTQSAALEISSNAFGGAVLASVHGRVAGDAEDANGTEIANSQYRDRGLSLRYVRDAEWGRLRTGVMSSIARDVGAPTSDTVLTLYPDERATLATIAFDLEQAGMFNAAAVRGSIGSYSITTNRLRATGVESAAVKARDASFRFSGDRAGARSRLVAGVDFVSRFDLHASGSVEDADRHNTGVFAAWNGGVARSLQFAAGARADHVTTRNRAGYFGDRSTNDVAFSGYGALTAGPFRNVSATVQVASGYREPSLSDRYFRGVSGRGFVTGNPDLEPERSVQLDGSVRWNGARSRVALYAYDYRIRNLVERYRAGADFFFRNRGEAEIRGVELETATRLMEHLEWTLGGAIAEGEDVDTGDALDDIGGPSLHSQVRWAAEGASVFMTVSAYGHDDRPGPVEVERAGYTEVDLGAGWRFSPHLELRVVLRNATNAQHFGSADEVAAFAPGRSVTIGINR
ncbi:MAG TPA: TonB-dependent receptor [Thermoanaerobaculia bacterium]|jgi:outer membrane receptor protein involved in Fe transport